MVTPHADDTGTVTESTSYRHTWSVLQYMCFLFQRTSSCSDSCWLSFVYILRLIFASSTVYDAEFATAGKVTGRSLVAAWHRVVSRLRLSSHGRLGGPGAWQRGQDPELEEARKSPEAWHVMGLDSGHLTKRGRNERNRSWEKQQMLVQFGGFTNSQEITK